MAQRIVIIGAGQAGFQVAASLRQKGFEGSITLVGEEPVAPYERPPLSKACLKGEIEEGQLLFRPLSFFEENAIDLQLSTRITEIDRNAMRVKTASGNHIAYDALILTTGAQLKKLNAPGSDLAGIYYLRTSEDAKHLKQAITPDTRMAVIGGGYIGLEVAASARHLGADVTVIEAAERVMSRTASLAIADFLTKRHKAAGVRMCLNTGVTGFQGNKGQLEAVTTSDGAHIPVDIAVIGIGVAPEAQLAKDCGLKVENGIVVDAYGRTSDPHIFAAGDCAFYAHPHAPHPMTIESVQNAVDQAKSVASVIMGDEKPYDAVPWFWSDQYGLKLQTVGLFSSEDEHIARHPIEEDAISVAHLRNGQLVAVETIGRMKDFVQAKKLIATKARPDRAKLIDATIPLKETL